eukprot:scaffold49354_cov98-Phaeocystis_antarctica.AAC.2
MSAAKRKAPGGSSGVVDGCLSTTSLAFMPWTWTTSSYRGVRTTSTTTGNFGWRRRRQRCLTSLCTWVMMNGQGVSLTSAQPGR